jgi:hypothetical protein
MRLSASAVSNAGQGELDLGIDGSSDSGTLEITSSRAAHLWDALSHGYDVLGFDEAAAGDEVFRQLVLARIIVPASKLDSLRVISEAGWRQRRMRRSSGVYQVTRPSSTKPR